MFFEDEDKDLSKNMDDYDLDFDNDKSISWDKLLDDGAEEQQPEQVLTSDDILLGDDESFNNLIQEQPLNVDENDSMEDFSEDNSIGNFDDDFEVEPQDNQNEMIDDDIIEVIDDVEDYDDSNSGLEPQIEPEIEPEQGLYQQAEPEIIPQQPIPPQQTATPLIQPQASYEPTGQIPQRQMTFDQTQQAQDDDIDYDADYSVKKKPAQDAQAGQKDNSALLGFLFAVALIVALSFGGFILWNNYFSNVSIEDASTGDMNTLAEGEQSDQDAIDSMFNPEGAQTDAGSGQSDPAAAAPGQDAFSNGSTSGAAEQDQSKKQVNIPPSAGVSKPVSGASAVSTNRVTLNVVTAGRMNPFTPTSSFNSLGFYTVPKTEVLEPPMEIGNLVDQVDKLMRITVSGILYDNVKPSAIVTIEGVDYFVQKGDMVDSYVVIGITQNTVAIKDGANIYKASIGQSFSKGPIDGQVNRASAAKGAPQRQYVTPNDIDINVKQPS